MAAHARHAKGLEHCRRCGRHVSACGRLTWVGQCLACAEGRLTENLQGLQDRQGDAWERWRAATLRAVLQAGR